jgi:hypothetical protein
MQASPRIRASSVVLSLLLTGEVAAQSGVVQDFGSASLQRAAPSAGTHFVYDAATGVVRQVSEAPRGFPLPSGAATSAVCFDNVDDTLWASSHPVTHQELVDWGVKQCGLRGRVTSFTFAYKTARPSVDLSIALYVGTTGFGNLGTQVRRFSFQGLPAGEDFFGSGLTLNTLTVDVSSNPICLPDGPIGWGFTNDDLESGIILSEAPNAVLGTLDALDVYDAPPAKTGVYTGTYNFASQGIEMASLSMDFEEEDGAGLSGVRLLRGSGVNPLALVPLGLPTFRTHWFADVDLTRAPGATMSTLVLAELPALAPLPTVAGEILIDLFNPPVLVSVGTTSHRIVIPQFTAALLDRTFYAQSLLSGGGALELTNGLALTIGR